MILGIDHIELIVRDVDEHVEFFTAMGFDLLRRTSHHGDSAELQLPGADQPIFEIHSVSGEEQPGVNHIAFRAEDVQQSYGELRSAGLRFEGEPGLVESTGRTIANFRDPDGWRMQLVDDTRIAPTA